jgi:hypothetical protein
MLKVRISTSHSANKDSHMRKAISKLVGPVLALTLLTGIIVAQSNQVHAAKAKRAADPRQAAIAFARQPGPTIVYTNRDGRRRADAAVTVNVA